LQDGDGNKLSAVQPGMLLDLGRNGEIQMVNPMRPNANIGEFVAHMLRSQATAVPGVKGSTLTADFRNSSISSERSADNDVWPEIESLQDWFAGGFCQPIYERLIVDAVAAGYFDGIIDADEFKARKEDYLQCGWQGPVARSINPADDAEASRKRVQNGQSSPQREAALIGRNWQELVMETKEYIAFAEEQELPESVIAQALGIDQQDDPMGSLAASQVNDGKGNQSQEDFDANPQTESEASNEAD
jgi:capsid protein